MTNWRTMAGALCIVLAMVLGAFAGFVYAKPGVVGASPGAGTRGEDRGLMSAFDEAQKLMTSDEAEDLASAEPQTALMTDSRVIETVTPDGTVTLTPVDPDDLRATLEEPLVMESHAGTITVQQDPVGTRTHFVGGEVDAGGPYGGADTMEGGPALTFTATANDPTIIFYRWDLNNDGLFDYPDQTGGGDLGKWTTSNTLTKQFFDDFLGDILVQGWDGVSTTVEFDSGDNLNEDPNFQWTMSPGGYNFAWRFIAKVNMQVTELGHYHYAYPLYDQGIWATPSGTKLGECMPAHSFFSWNWCTLPSAATLLAGQEYRISIRLYFDSPFMTGIDTPADTDHVSFISAAYCYSPFVLCYPSSDWVDFAIPQVDFRWQETIVKPDAAEDTAVLQINNVAPVVSGVTTVPSPALEGSPADFTAAFTDPGTDDTWEYRWKFHDGEVTSWRTVSKFNGGAKVLLFHTYGPDGEGLLDDFADQCGNFCTKFDFFDFGPTGQNRVPDLSEVTPYDVLVVGTNYFFGHSDGIGDLLADYMDVGGAVVIMQGALDNAFGCGAGICGRWDEDMYSPIPRGFIYGSGGSMGSIYVPGHPLLDGVSSVGTNGLAGEIYDTNPGAQRIVDWNDGRVLGATNTNPVVDNGARSVALNFFPLYGLTTGDFARMTANAIRWASQQPDPTVKDMPIQLDPLTKIYRDDHPTTTTPVDTFQATVEVKDDDHAPPGQMFYQDDMESGANGWTATDLWHQTDYRSNSPLTSWAFNDESTHEYGGFCCNTHTGTLTMGDSVSPGGADGLRLRFASWQQTENGGSEGNFYDERTVQVSPDDGSSWVSLEWDGTNELGNSYSTWYTYDFKLDDFSSADALKVRFFFNTVDVLFNDYEGWYIDDVFIGVPDPPRIQNGIGSGTGDVTIANVPPTAIGGFDSALRMESQTLKFQGFEISDPAILEPTEWFAYAWDFDDGSAVDWRFVGSLAPPKFDILVIHTICLGLIDSTCPDLQVLVDTLKAQDDVGIVKTHNFINYPALPTAPTLNEMLQYDLIIVATNWAYFSYAPFDLARRQVGDRAAAYIDAGRGGVFTFMCVYCLSGGNDLFSIRGRYMDDDYGAFERANYLFPGASGLNILVPEHDLFVKVDPTKVGSAFIHDGNMPLTTGGKGAAAGVAGQLLARWSGDSTPSVGVKELNNGMRTAHFGAFGRPDGSSTGTLLRNFIGWTAGGIPSPKIQAFDYVYGDNGIYTVDFMAIDDDMGFVWDVATNMPVQVLPDSALSHRFVEVSVDNVDPTIQEGSIEAFIAAEACVRIAGTPGNTVTLNVWTDGVLSMAASVTRIGGDPNPPIESCGLLKVDVTAIHVFRATLDYSAPSGGSNPTWLIIGPWREPVTPGHGTVTYQYDFVAGGPTSVDQPLPTLKTDLLWNGHGAVVDFAAEAWDSGTDDLAFMWVWGNGEEAQTFFDPGPREEFRVNGDNQDHVVSGDHSGDVLVNGNGNSVVIGGDNLGDVRVNGDGNDVVIGGWVVGDLDVDGNDNVVLVSCGVTRRQLVDGNGNVVLVRECPALYGIHVHHNDGRPVSDGTLDAPDRLGFSEPYFDRGANDARSPLGTMNFRVRDTAARSFDGTQVVYYVVLIVWDDDNTRGYASPFGPFDGIDMAVVYLDFR